MAQHISVGGSGGGGGAAEDEEEVAIGSAEIASPVRAFGARVTGSRLAGHAGDTTKRGQTEAKQRRGADLRSETHASLTSLLLLALQL